MNTQNYSIACPFCETQIAPTSRVCGTCRATKTTRAGTMRGAALLMRTALWCNTLGLILFATLLVAWGQLRDELVLRGTEKVCYADVLWTRAAPIPQLAPTIITKVIRLAAQACEDTHDLERRKAALALGAKKPENGGSGAQVEVKNIRTGLDVKQGGVTREGEMQAIGRALAALALGWLLFWLARKLWIRLLGRMSDPMWVRSQ